MDLSRGILTGSDARMELFLPWWFDHYQRHNSYPVAIVDFGLSDWGKRVAKRIGTLIDGPEAPTHPLGKSPLRIHSQAYFQEKRSVWFSKPLALINTPFEQTLWIDIDCKIKAELSSCFGIEFGATPNRKLGNNWGIKHGYIQPGEKLYNSGFITFSKRSSLLKAWCDEVTQNGHKHISDDYAMTALINSKKWPFTPIHQDYNTSYADADEKTKIVHYIGIDQKWHIYQEMIAKTLGFTDE